MITEFDSAYDRLRAVIRVLRSEHTRHQWAMADALKALQRNDPTTAADILRGAIGDVK